MTRGILSLEKDATKPEEKWESYYKDLPENKDVDFETFKKKLEKDAKTADEAWVKYMLLPAFENVKIEQFKARLKAHRQQVKKYLKRSKEDEQLMLEDRKRFPKVSVNDENGQCIRQRNS